MPTIIKTTGKSSLVTEEMKDLQILTTREKNAKFLNKAEFEKAFSKKFPDKK